LASANTPAPQCLIGPPRVNAREATVCPGQVYHLHVRDSRAPPQAAGFRSVIAAVNAALAGLGRGLSIELEALLGQEPAAP
jgi:hypothetical protein